MVQRRISNVLKLTSKIITCRCIRFNDITFLVFSNMKVMEKKDEFFSLLVFKDITARHSGKYTCYATNSAAKVNYTAELFVKGMHDPKSVINLLIFPPAKLINLKYRPFSAPHVDVRTAGHKCDAWKSDIDKLRC